MMSEKKESKHDNYNKKRKPLFRVEIALGDDAALLERIKGALIDKSGTPKQGIIDLYKFAEKLGYFSK